MLEVHHTAFACEPDTRARGWRQLVRWGGRFGERDAQTDHQWQKEPPGSLTGGPQVATDCSHCIACTPTHVNHASVTTSSIRFLLGPAPPAAAKGALAASSSSEVQSVSRLLEAGRCARRRGHHGKNAP